MKTVPTIKIKRTEMDFIVINESDFNPNIHTLWTKDDSTRATAILAAASKESDVVKKAVNEKIEKTFGVNIEAPDSAIKEEPVPVPEMPSMPTMLEKHGDILLYGIEFYPEAELNEEMTKAAMLSAIVSAKEKRKAEDAASDSSETFAK